MEKSKNKYFEFIKTTLNGMAYGLFATLIVGTIFGTIGKLFSLGEGNKICDFFFSIFGDGKVGVSFVLQVLTGAGIGAGIALILKFDALKTIVISIVGEIAAYFSLPMSFVSKGTYQNSVKVGDPLTVYLVVIATVLAMSFILKKKTKTDLVLVPFVGVALGLVFSLLIRYPAIYVTYSIKWLVNNATNAAPFIMGIVVAVVMGMALTAPISSAAIAAMVFVIPEGLSISQAVNNPEYSGLIIASGAAIIGCSTQMVGFAIESLYDNDKSCLVSVGIGTSMLQFKNIMNKPLIWLPTIIASAILGPISTCWFQVICTGASAGMGTAGFVGQIGTLSSMGVSSFSSWIAVFGFEIIFPGVLVFLIDLLFRKLKIIKKGDFTL